MSDLNSALIRKVHAGADDTCFISILTDWNSSKMNDIAQEVFDLACDGLSLEDIGKAVGISKKATLKLLNEYKQRYCSGYESTFYDRLFLPDELNEQFESLVKTEQPDAYFSINSFYKRKRKNENVRHINAFVLDFDFYKIQKYEEMEASEFYKEIIAEKLIKEPTAVIDSGRGLYVIYTFNHCSYHMDRLYHAIFKSFYRQFERYGMDPAATLTTQVIRIPGTINSKTNKTVQVLELNDTDYRLQDFADQLTWTLDEVKNHRKNKVKKVKNMKPTKDFTKRKKHFALYFDDFKKLIRIRNKKNISEGYREQLLFLCRERACWMGYTIDESIKLAFELNQMFRVPLIKSEVENNCRPSANRLACSIDTMIDKLGITIDEQLQLQVLKRRHIKKSVYAKHKRKHPLSNLTEKQQAMMERRAKVCELKNVKHLKNSEIADRLGIDKSTVTRDLHYIKANPVKFIRKLTDYINALEKHKNSDLFKRKTLYERQKQLLKWLKSGYTALDYLVREIGVAKK